MKKVMKDILLKLVFNNQENYLNFTMILPERMKLKKVEKLVTNLHDKNECVIRIRNLKQPSNHVLILEEVHGVIKFNSRRLAKNLF